MKHLFLFTTLLFLDISLNAQQVAADSTLLLMGTRFELKVVGPSSEVCKNAVLLGIKEVQRIEELISEYKPQSESSLINRNAGIQPVKVSAEMFGLVIRSLKMSKLTDGAFDISFLPMYHFWKFDGSMKEMPPADSVKKYLDLVGYQKIVLNTADTSVFLPKKGMCIGLGGIGKGYAANQAMKVMLGAGATGGYVNAAGDILFKGRNADGALWNVAIASPVNKKQMLGNLQVEDMAVVTSGNYEKFFTLGGKTYSHIIDPKTGYPTEETISVTIFCPDAEMADALATGVSVLGVDEGLKLINQIKGFECLMVDSKHNIYKSDNLSLNLVKY